MNKDYCGMTKAAFPVPENSSNYGMSLRDWFAGQALRLDIVQRQTPYGKEMAAEAYRIADAMMEARKR